MKLTVSSKGQLVIPAPILRKYRIRARSKVELEERDEGLFIRPATASTGVIPPIEYLPPGAIRYTARDLAFVARAAEVVAPDEVSGWTSGTL